MPCGSIRDEEHAGRIGNVLDPGRSDPPPTVVQEVEERTRLPQVERIETEVVDVDRALLHTQEWEPAPQVLEEAQGVQSGDPCPYTVAELTKNAARGREPRSNPAEAALDLAPERSHGVLQIAELLPRNPVAAAGRITAGRHRYFRSRRLTTKLIQASFVV